MNWLKKRFVKKCIKGIGLILFAALLAYVINQFGIALSVVNGTSMQPTLQDGDRLLINKFSILFNPPKKGDVITFRDPSNPERYLVKRVIGLPGDTVEIKNGVLYVNGVALKEPYINSRIEDGDFGPVRVKEGTVFVMGDNRHRFASRDSRYDSVGLVPFDLINGKVELILWRPSLEAYL